MKSTPTPSFRGSITVLSISLAVIGAPACAQEAAVAAATSTPGPSDTGLTTVVVTAQKRSQNIKEVPIAMSVVGAAQLERAGVKDIADLSKTAASLEFGDQKAGGAGGSASIRGIGSAVFTISAESSVGVVVDGVSLGSTASGLMLDLARVEVLRGPQGTLFGKNASAGVLNMSTQAPVIGETGGNLALEYKGNKGASVRATVNVPINAMSALRVSGLYDVSDGVYHNVFTDQDSKTGKGGVRLRYLLKPTSELNINLIAESSRSKSTGATFFAPMIANASNTAGNHRPLAEFAACGVTVSRDNHQVCSDSPELERTRVNGLSGQLDWSLANGATLTSISSLRERKAGPNATAVDMSLGYDKVRNFDVVGSTRQVTQELRLASATRQPIEYVAGFFYSDADNDRVEKTQILPNPALPSPPVPRSILTDSARGASLTTRALFGQATFRVSEAASILAGLRYTRDSISSFFNERSTVAFANFGLPATVRTSSGSATESNLSGKLGLQYAVSKDFNAYASATRGYKGPQIDDTTLLLAGSTAGTYGTLLVRPESPTSVEVGAKLSLLERKVDLDVALFHTTIKDFQEQNCTLSAVGALNCIPLNVPEVTSKGVEIDLRARPVPQLLVGASMAAILDTAYPAGFSFDGINVGGERLLYSPKLKATVSADYSWSLANDYELRVGGEMVYKSAVRLCNTLDAGCSFKGHTIPALRAALRGPDDKWGLLLYARNLNDVRVPNAILYPLPGKGAGSGFAHALGENSFRTIGLTLDARF